MISSPDNPKVRAARALLRRKGRQQAGQCLAEGVQLIADAMRAGIMPALIFFLASARQSPRVAALLERAAQAGVPTWELSPTLFGTLSDTTTSQGVIAVLPIPAPEPPANPNLILILDQVRDPGNVGTILRSAEAAGVDLVLLMAGCADAWSPKVLRAGMGAHFRLPLRAGVTGDELARWLGDRPLWLADPRGELSYDQIDWCVPCAVALGGETVGFSSQVETLGRGRVAIPMAGGAESLNVAMAATVLLFEAARQRREAAILGRLGGRQAGRRASSPSVPGHIIA
jgi:TrmH family RNA methyltransferase